MARQVMTHPKRIRNLEQSDTALRLRVSGATYEQIAQQLNVTRSRAYAIVSNAIATKEYETKELANEVRAIELERLNEMTLRLRNAIINEDPTEPQFQAYQTLLKVMERRSKMLGLDASTSVNLSGINGSPIAIQAYGSVDYSKWETKDLETLQEMGSKYKNTILEEQEEQEEVEDEK